MEATLVRKAISIQADLFKVQEILTEHSHIKSWDNGFDLFREIHIKDQGYTIVHWDIEHDIDYVFDLAISDRSVILELSAKNTPENQCSIDRNISTYIRTVLARIKEYSERLQGIQTTLIPSFPSYQKTLRELKQ